MVTKEGAQVLPKHQNVATSERAHREVTGPSWRQWGRVRAPRQRAKGAGGSREATGSPPACVNVCVFKVAALISNVTGSKNGFWPLLSEMVAEKRVTEGLPISEYPMWSELTHVQLALEPTAWAADSYFQGNDNDNVSSIFMCRQRRS